ncbi:hypothetical protein BO221_00760 [Archangium sp. Cb G35]|uniref:hypothetical protein n=1 Tax=Archangium sp. Cb G35 TaxID=1920190 RepID=UPI00096A074A|nr:hypothetical protein [Archangium sp. Cb G35]OJT26607.1 hypothetical protein BO221_00760 [Archangium sp. Cb G35]
MSLALVLGLGMPGPEAWAARGTRSARSAKKAGKAKARKGPQPKLLTPAEDAELQPGRKVTFKWKVAAKLVRLQVARDEEFTDTVIDRPVKGRFAILPLEEGSYHWRVSVKGIASDPRRLTVGTEPPPESQPESQPVAQAQPEETMTGGLGLDLTAATTPSDTSTESSSDTIAQTSAAEPVTSEPARPVEAEAERPSSSQRGNQKRWSVLIGGSAAFGPGAPNSMASLRYEASVAFRIANPFELSLAVGGTSLNVLGTRDETWPYYTWSGQYYFDLGARYRLVRFEGGALFGLVAGRVSFFTASPEQLGFLAERSPFSAGAGVALRFRAGLPLELGVRGNVITGKSLGGELELGLRVMVF